MDFCNTVLSKLFAVAEIFSLAHNLTSKNLVTQSLHFEIMLLHIWCECTNRICGSSLLAKFASAS